MKILRRSLLTGIGAVGTMSVLPRAAWAPPPPPSPKKGVCAVKFDGGCYLKRDQSDNSYPTASPYLAVRYLYNNANAAAYQGNVLLSLSTDDGGNNIFIWGSQSSTKNQKTQLTVGVNNWPSSGGSQWSSGFVLPRAGAWNEVDISIDGTMPSCVVRVDRVPITMFPAGGNTATIVDYYSGRFNAVPRWTVGGVHYGFGPGAPPNCMKQSLAELFVYVGTPIDWASYDANFWDSVNQVPVRHASTGRDGIPGITPNIYLSGPTSRFGTNFAQMTPQLDTATWTEPSPPTSFYVAVGSLKVPAADPWGFVGV